MNLKESLQYAVEIAPPITIEAMDVHGVKTLYSSKPIHQIVAAAHKLPEIVHVATLAGIADLVKAELEAANFTTEHMLHVQDEQTVCLQTKESDEFGRRTTLIQAQPVPFEKFRFGQWMSQEEFVIAVASRFAETEDKDYILQLASTLTNEAVMTHEDDGFTQKATAKAGMRTKESVTLKPRVSLAPFRTFPELEQPISTFIFRARCNGEEKPMLMLVEADGGRWKIDAIKKIAIHLGDLALNIPIIA